MLPNVTSCLLSWLLFAALSAHLWRATVGTPVRTLQKADPNECVGLSRALLSSVTKALARDELFDGFNCSERSMIPNNMLSACQPNAGQDKRCSGTQNSEFNQEECLGSIQQDLQDHRNKLLAYQRPDLDSTVGKAIQDLLEDCKFPRPRRDSPVLTTSISPPFSKSSFKFEARDLLCRELKGLHARSITINRIMGYMAA